MQSSWPSEKKKDQRREGSQGRRGVRWHRRCGPAPTVVSGGVHKGVEVEEGGGEGQ